MFKFRDIFRDITTFGSSQYQTTPKYAH